MQPCGFRLSTWALTPGLTRTNNPPVNSRLLLCQATPNAHFSGTLGALRSAVSRTGGQKFWQKSSSGARLQTVANPRPTRSERPISIYGLRTTTLTPLFDMLPRTSQARTTTS
jgi:hypothetical protein